MNWKPVFLIAILLAVFIGSACVVCAASVEQNPDGVNETQNSIDVSAAIDKCKNINLTNYDEGFIKTEKVWNDFIGPSLKDVDNVRHGLNNSESDAPVYEHFVMPGLFVINYIHTMKFLEPSGYKMKIDSKDVPCGSIIKLMGGVLAQLHHMNLVRSLLRGEF